MDDRLSVIGAGLAGLNFAINLARKRRNVEILIFDKSFTGECNTRYASGGIAAANSLNEADIESHIKDTMLAGCDLNNKKAVNEIIRGGPQAISDLLNYGVQFDQDSNGNYDKHLEGGHSERRIYHHDDITGKEILEKLKKEVESLSNIRILPGHMTIDLITEINEEGENICCGIKVLDLSKNEILIFRSNAVVIASGGLGQIFKSSTNSNIATGDGIAMAIRANVEINDMEFVQFHPTALYQDNVKDYYLITEALRGEGARICDIDGNDILEKYHGVNNLSPRYKVSLAIKNEIKKSSKNWVYLDCTSIDKHILKNQFQSFWNKCREVNLDPSKEKIPILPAAHYLCGGISTDTNGASSLSSLYAIGESANTGFHGANRLASNSLLEAIVVSKNCSSKVAKTLKINAGNLEINKIKAPKKDQNDEAALIAIRDDLKLLMENHSSLIRSNISLRKALNEIKEMMVKYDEKAIAFPPSRLLYEVRNMLVVGLSVVEASLNRPKAIGCFCISDRKKIADEVIMN